MELEFDEQALDKLLEDTLKKQSKPIDQSTVSAAWPNN